MKSCTGSKIVRLALILCTGLGLMGIFVTLLADETLRGTANLACFCLFAGNRRTTDG